MLIVIGILYFLMAGIIYDTYGLYDETIWNVYYFGSVYLSFLLISLDRYLYSYDKIIKGYMASAMILFFALIIRELSLINLPYKLYIISINSDISKIIGISYIGITSFLMSYIFLKNYFKNGNTKKTTS